jgi:hypothetical protein
MKRLIRLCIRLLPVIAILLLGVEIIVANELAGLGDDLGTVNAAVDQERAVNEQLATRVASSSSLIAIREKAATLGFHEPTKTQTLVFNPSELPVALTNSVR